MNIGLSKKQIEGILERRIYPDLLDSSGRMIACHCTLSYDETFDKVTLSAPKFSLEANREELWYNSTYCYLQLCFT